MNSPNQSQIVSADPWNGLDFTSQVPSRSSDHPLLAAIKSRDVEAVTKQAAQVSRRSQRLGVVTQWLSENFSPQIADALWEMDMVIPSQSWGWAMEHRRGDQLEWWLSDRVHIRRLCSHPFGKPARTNAQTLKEWNEEMVTLSKLAPDVYLTAMRSADWAEYMTYRRAGDGNSLIAAWVKAFSESSIDPSVAAPQLARAFSPDVMISAFGSYKGHSVNEAMAAAIDPVRKQLLQAEPQVAARLQALVKSSEVLSDAWRLHWEINSGSVFARQSGMSLSPTYYQMPGYPINGYGSGSNSFLPTNILQNMICEGSPALCSLLVRSPSPAEQPGGLASQVCATLENHPELAYLLFSKASTQQSPAVAARLSAWMPEFKFKNFTMAHLAIWAVPTVGMAVALSRAETPDNPLFSKLPDGTTVLDIFISKDNPKQAVIDRVVSARSEKKRKSLMKIASEKDQSSKPTPFM